MQSHLPLHMISVADANPSAPLNRRRPPTPRRRGHAAPPKSPPPSPPCRLPAPLPSPPARLPLLSTSTSSVPFSLEDYLVATCGLTPAQARKASQKALAQASKFSRKPFGELSHCRLYSASNPDAVLALLSGVGLARADIAANVCADPLILRSAVSNIGPRLLALRDRVGLSAPQIARFLLVGSRALRCGDVGPSVEFLISFYGSFEKLLVIMKRNNSILTTDLERVIKRNIAYLRQCGLSVRDFVQMCSYNTWIIGYNPERVKEFVLRLEKLGVPRSSGIFKYVMLNVAHVNEEKFAARLEFLKRTLGCSQTEAIGSVSKTPVLVVMAEEYLLRKVQFLINEVGMEPQYISERPSILTYSLEKRLVPRYHIMKFLQAKGLLDPEWCFFPFIVIGEGTFKSKFIDCHKDSVPGLADAYAAACAGNVPPVVHLLTS